MYRFLQRSIRDWPAMRATTPQWRRWIVRQLLIPVVRVPMTVTTRSGTRVRLGADRVDDIILRDIHAGHPALYFPPVTPADADGPILDVGAHHGLYAIEALRRHRAHRAIAVEPDPSACRRIAEHARLNGVEGRLRIVCAGLADVSGQGWLERDRSGSWGHRVRPGDRDPAPRAGEPVVLRTLAQILDGERPSIVKCNAEGAEFALVPQLIALGLRPALVVLMVHPRVGAAAGLVGALEDARYAVQDADDPPRGHRFHCRAV